MPLKAPLRSSLFDAPRRASATPGSRGAIAPQRVGPNRCSDRPLQATLGEAARRRARRSSFTGLARFRASGARRAPRVDQGDFARLESAGFQLYCAFGFVGSTVEQNLDSAF